MPIVKLLKRVCVIVWDRGDLTRPEIDDSIHEVWVRSALEYVTSSTTVYKLAAASLIFKASQAKWRDVLESLQKLPLRSAEISQIPTAAEIAVSFLTILK